MPGMLNRLREGVGQKIKAYAQWVNQGGTLPGDEGLRTFGSYLGVTEHPDAKRLREKQIETESLIEAYKKEAARRQTGLPAK